MELLKILLLLTMLYIATCIAATFSTMLMTGKDRITANDIRLEVSCRSFCVWSCLMQG